MLGRLIKTKSEEFLAVKFHQLPDTEYIARFKREDEVEDDEKKRKGDNKKRGRSQLRGTTRGSRGKSGINGTITGNRGRSQLRGTHRGTHRGTVRGTVRGSRGKSEDHGSRGKGEDHGSRGKSEDRGSRGKSEDHGSRGKSEDNGSRGKSEVQETENRRSKGDSVNKSDNSEVDADESNTMLNESNDISEGEDSQNMNGDSENYESYEGTSEYSMVNLPEDDDDDDDDDPLYSYFYREKRYKTLCPENEKERIDWARRMMNEPSEMWKNILFVDSMRFSCETWNSIENGVDVFSIEVFAAFCFEEKLELIFYYKEIKTSIIFLDIYEKHCIPFSNSVFPDACTIQLSKSSILRSTSVIEYLKRKSIGVLPWPALSFDLSPFEMAWDLLLKNIRDKKIAVTNNKELFESLQYEWEQIPMEELQMMIMRMPERIEQLIKAHGRGLNLC